MKIIYFDFIYTYVLDLEKLLGDEAPILEQIGQDNIEAGKALSEINQKGLCIVVIESIYLSVYLFFVMTGNIQKTFPQ